MHLILIDYFPDYLKNISDGHLYLLEREMNQHLCHRDKDIHKWFQIFQLQNVYTQIDWCLANTKQFSSKGFGKSAKFKRNPECFSICISD